MNMFDEDEDKGLILSNEELFELKKQILKVEHDFYLKLFHLSKQYDIIALD